MIVQTQTVTFDTELRLQSGATLGPITVAYETYGTLNEDHSNAILICHAWSGDAHVAGRHSPDDPKSGWWDEAVGPGKAFDTDKYFVVCSNVIGGCSGSTGPASINPQTGNPYGLSFPIVTIADMVEVQRWLMDYLGLAQWLTVVGGSMGGMQALQWAVSYPERMRSTMVLAATASLSPQSIALSEVARQAIYADPNWNHGDYYDKTPPNAGLAVARMIGHITFLSDESMRAKFGRRLTNEKYGYSFDTEFEVEGYLRYRGNAFTKRFDANAFLYLSKSMDYFDLSYGQPSLASAFKHITDTHFLVVSYTSDWLYPSRQSKELVRALLQNGINVTYVEIESNYGHDAFLLEVERLAELTHDFLSRFTTPAHPSNGRAAQTKLPTDLAMNI